MNEREVLARYRAMKRWVERERQRLERTGGRKSQRFLRRSRLVIDVDPITLRELIRELDLFTVRRRRRRFPFTV